MELKVTILFIIIFISTDMLANDSLNVEKIKVLTSKVDSLSVLFNYEISLNKKYIDIVDRTNNNLNMSWTPTSIIISFVGIFCVFFSILTFMMAYGSRQEVSKLIKQKSLDFDKIIEMKISEINEMIKAKSKAVGENEFFTTVETQLDDVINLIKKHN